MFNEEKQIAEIKAIHKLVKKTEKKEAKRLVRKGLAK